MQVLILQQLPGGDDGFFLVFQSTTGNSQLELYLFRQPLRHPEQRSAEARNHDGAGAVAE